MLLSVVVPISTTKYIDRLKACVASVEAQDYPQNKIQLILTYLARGRITEDISPLRIFCEAHGALLVEYVHQEAGWPPSLSRNVGYRKSEGDILVSLDADGVLDKRTFRVAVERMKKARCAVRVRTSLVPRPPGAPIFFKLGEKQFQRSVDLGKKAPGPGCCILATRTAVFEIHGWDEKYVGYGPADWDFVERLEKAGYPVVNLSGEEGIWTLHQEHKRILGTPLQHKNRGYHERSKLNSDPKRNARWWGGEKS